MWSMKQFSSPFIEERLYFLNIHIYGRQYHSSRPLLSRSGCIYIMAFLRIKDLTQFSSPFIEERLYLIGGWTDELAEHVVLVPFYRGAVVFPKKLLKKFQKVLVLVPFYRGAVVFRTTGKFSHGYELVLVPFYRGAVVFTSTLKIFQKIFKFSSPFIEERLYLITNSQKAKK